jgi:hypothetical protein
MTAPWIAVTLLLCFMFRDVTVISTGEESSLSDVLCTKCIARIRPQLSVSQLLISFVQF